MSASDDDAPWYAAGLRFACTRCGNCCSGAPGHVWVSLAEAERIAAHLGLSFDDFAKRHLRRVGTRLNLLEKTGGDCEFLVRPTPTLTACAIHAVCPTQCRTWPFWASNLASREAWQETARGCPGIDQGSYHPLPVIQAALEANGDLPL